MILDFFLKSPEELLREIQTQKIKTTEFEKQIIGFLKTWLNPSDTFPAKTSGSTGFPKVIDLQKKLAAESASRFLEYFKLKPGDSVLLCLSPRFIAGQMMIVRAVTGRLRLVCFEPDFKPECLENQAIDFAAMASVQAFKSMSRISLVKTLLLGGGPLEKSLERKIAEKHPRAFMSYGMTETYSQVALRQILVDAGPKYEALEGVSFSLGKENSLIIDTEIAVVNPLQTDDVVELISPKSFIWKGRRSNVILSGGIKIYPEILEEKFSTQIKLPFFIAGIPDERLGFKVVLFVERLAKQKDFLKFKQIISEELNPLFRPRRLFSLDEFEFTETGKIRRGKTLNKFLEQSAGIREWQLSNSL